VQFGHCGAHDFEQYNEETVMRFELRITHKNVCTNTLKSRDGWILTSKREADIAFNYSRQIFSSS
jgi:hypothetical protein